MDAKEIPQKSDSLADKLEQAEHRCDIAFRIGSDAEDIFWRAIAALREAEHYRERYKKEGK